MSFLNTSSTEQPGKMKGSSMLMSSLTAPRVRLETGRVGCRGAPPQEEDVSVVSQSAPLVEERLLPTT